MFKYPDTDLTYITFNYHRFNIYFKPDIIMLTKNYKYQSINYKEALKEYPFKMWDMLPDRETLLELFPKTFTKIEYRGIYNPTSTEFKLCIKANYVFYYETSNECNTITYTPSINGNYVLDMTAFLLKLLTEYEAGNIEFDSTDF